MPTYRQAGRRGAAGQRRRHGLVEVDACARPVLPRSFRRGRAPAGAGSAGRFGPATRTLVAAVEALLLAARSELDQAEARARDAVAIAETETDNVWLQGWSNEDLALVLERAGRIDEAREALGRALAVWERKRCLPFVRRVREQIDSLGRAQV